MKFCLPTKSNLCGGNFSDSVVQSVGSVQPLPTAIPIIFIRETLGSYGFLLYSKVSFAKVGINIPA